MTARTWWVRIVIAVLLGLVGWVLVVSSKQIERNRRIQDEVSALETEAAKIRRENETLSEKISYFSSDDFREREAKQKLGLKKAGETAVVIRQSPDTDAGTEAAMEVRQGDSGDIPNYEKWWKIFF
ncbi:MAG: septum formation initiator family protein [Patescibacteria group bacterium]